MPDKPGRRHPLLLYTRQLSRLRGATFLISVFSFILWYYALRIPPLSPAPVQAALIVAGVAAGLFFVYSLLGPRLSYVQCFPTFVRISTPLYRLVLSYSRIRSVRPVQFEPRRKLSSSQREILRPLLGQTCLAADLNGYPLGEKWLRFWLPPFMFAEDFTGLLFHVKDWMALSQEMESFRSLRKVTRVQTPSINPFSYH
jgi:hypothetical protein